MNRVDFLGIPCIPCIVCFPNYDVVRDQPARERPGDAIHAATTRSFLTLRLCKTAPHLKADGVIGDPSARLPRSIDCIPGPVGRHRATAFWSGEDSSPHSRSAASGRIQPSSRTMSLALVPPAVLYGLLNIASATGIVFANKAVFSWHAFSFPYALTFVHTLVTYVGMQMFLRWGVFEGRQDILATGDGGVKVRIMCLSVCPSHVFAFQ